MVTYTAAVFTAAAPVAAPRSGGGALSEGQTALHSLLGTLPTSGAPCGPAAGDAGGEPTRVSQA